MLFTVFRQMPNSSGCDVNKLLYIHTVKEQLVDVKRNENVFYILLWRDLQDILLCEKKENAE